MEPTTVVVCGAGIAGLTVAGDLARAGWAVTVLERSPARRDHGYMVDFFGPGFDAAEEMGLLPRLRELAYDVDVVCFVDGSGREREVDYRLVAAAGGGRLLSLLRPDLELALLERLPAGVRVRFGADVAAVTQDEDSATVHLADGTALAAAVVVGADGIRSRVRGAVAGPVDLRRLGLHTCAFTFDDPDLHARLGSRWHLTDTLHRMAGHYALRDGRVAFLGAHRVAEPGLPADARAAVLAAYAGLDAATDRALAHCPPSGELYYDEVAQVEPSRWSAGRVGLAGDACQAVSLVAGQGASLAVAGGRLLARELVDAPTPAAAFRAHEERWRPVVEERQRAGRRAAASFLPRTRTALLTRRVALQLLQHPLLGHLVRTRITGRRTPALR